MCWISLDINWERDKKQIPRGYWEDMITREVNEEIVIVN